MRSATAPLAFAALAFAALAFASTFVGCEDPKSAAPPKWALALGASASAERESASDAGGSAGSPACGKAGARLGVMTEHVPVFGKTRSYTLVVPASYSPSTPYPLVYVLHGHGGTGAQVRSAFDLESAAKEQAIFLYPDGLGGGWDLDSPTSKNADVALFDATLALTQSNYCVDLRRVFVTGFSNGAYMANQLGCRRGDRIRAVATHSGGGPYEATGDYDARGHLVCKGKAIASLIVHGASDGTVAPAEGEKSLDHWTYANHCSGSAPTSPAGCVAYHRCTSPVISCKVPGLGHGVWPPAKQLTWTFFDAQK
jgi:polyhydroxybutyrate depolymerase